MKTTLVKTSLSLISLVLLSACGGNSSSNPTAENSPTTEEIANKTGVGYYVDGPVEGVEYDCGNQNGVTDNNGTFTFEEGENCTFTLGGITLREVNASELEDNMILFENNLETSQLLQTLDNDGDSDNGIQIAQNVLESIKAGGLTELPIGADAMGALFQDMEGVEGYEGSLVSLEEAQTHLQTTIQELNLSTDILSNFNLLDGENSDDDNISDEDFDFDNSDLDSLDEELDNLLNNL